MWVPLGHVRQPTGHAPNRAFRRHSRQGFVHRVPISKINEVDRAKHPAVTPLLDTLRNRAFDWIGHVHRMPIVRNIYTFI